MSSTAVCPVQLYPELKFGIYHQIKDDVIKITFHQYTTYTCTHVIVDCSWVDRAVGELVFFLIALCSNITFRKDTCIP